MRSARTCADIMDVSIDVIIYLSKSTLIPLVHCAYSLGALWPIEAETSRKRTIGSDDIGFGFVVVADALIRRVCVVLRTCSSVSSRA